MAGGVAVLDPIGALGGLYFGVFLWGGVLRNENYNHKKITADCLRCKTKIKILKIN